MGRVSGRILGCLSAVALVATTAGASQWVLSSAASAAPQSVWNQATQIVTNARPSDVSCTSPGNCTIVGAARSSARTAPMVATETSGSWGMPGGITLPSNVVPTRATTPQATTIGISCTLPGDCTLVGWYHTSTGVRPMAATETAGTWGKAVEITVPSNAATTSTTGFAAAADSVSCTSPGNCELIGSYVAVAPQTVLVDELMVATETGGTWGQATEITPPTSSTTPLNVTASPRSGGISCSSPGNCSLVWSYYPANSRTVTTGVYLAQRGILIRTYTYGYYYGTTREIFVSTQTAGTWGPDIDVTLPPNATPRTAAGADGISCSSAGNCTFVGTYLSTAGFKALGADETSGTWGAATEIPDPAFVTGTTFFTLSVLGVSCTSPGDCTLVGNYRTDTSYRRPMVATEASGAWQQPTQIPIPLNASSSSTGSMDAISCPTAGGCTVVGVSRTFTSTTATVSAIAATESTATGGASGYDLVGSDGGVFAFPTGSSGGFYGSLPGLGISVNNIVGMVPTTNDKGYFLVGDDGGVFAFGNAPFHGSLPGIGVVPSARITGLVATATDNGYFLVGADGGVFAFGNAPFLGSLPSKGIAANDIIGISATPSGNGYWLLAATGAVYGFGAAKQLGTAKFGTTHGISSPATAIAGTPDGNGYWVVTRSGNVYPFGDAKGFDTLPSLGVNPALEVVGVVHTSDTNGYWLMGADGGVYAFGDAGFAGSLPGLGVQVTNIVGAVPTTA